MPCPTLACALAAGLAFALPTATLAPLSLPPPSDSSLSLLTDAPWPRSIVLHWTTDDGVPLEGKLTLPGDARSPAPVVFFLHGAGPRTYDNPMRYVDDAGERQVGAYLDFHARQLADRGIAFFRMSKRGCKAHDGPPWMTLDREVFLAAAPSVLLADYASALHQLRARPEIDPDNIALLGASEGTRLAPQLALAHPQGIRGIAMIGFAADNAREIITWQNSVGPWRNIQHMMPQARAGDLPRAAYEQLLADDPTLAAQLAFDSLDLNRDGILTEAEVVQAVRPRLRLVLDAVEHGNDALLTQLLPMLSSAYLREWWDAEPTVQYMLPLDIPIAIFHGALDGTCRVEGVHEARAAFDAAGKPNLFVRLFDDADHDLNLTWASAQTGSAMEYIAVFDHIARLLRPLAPAE
ncbi:MAG: hypothetical protein KIT24_06765 [Phycisphaeraceae bacterium]|nr:hypothetical protein [Phycisphaeraceae bacterium]